MFKNVEHHNSLLGVSDVPTATHTAGLGSWPFLLRGKDATIQATAGRNGGQRAIPTTKIATTILLWLVCHIAVDRSVGDRHLGLL